MKSHNLKPGDLVRVSELNGPGGFLDIKVGDYLMVVEDKAPDHVRRGDFPNWVLLTSPLGIHYLLEQNGYANAVWLDADWLEKVEDGALLPDDGTESTT